MKLISYENAGIADLPHIVEMKIAMFKESGHGDLLAPNARTLVLKDYEAMYEGSLAIHKVARTRSGIIACAGAFIKSDLPYRYFDPPMYGFLGDVYTQAAYRGKGIASHLSAEAIAWLRSRKIRMVRLLATDAASSIYSSMGFEPSDEMVLTWPT